MKVLLSTALLAGALEASAKDDIRNYLNGVCIDFVNEDEVVIVGTDGSILFAAHDRPEFEINSGFTGQVVIPRETVASALKGKMQHVRLRMYTLDAESVCTLGEVMFKPLDAKYPAYTRVIPSAVSGEPASFDIEVLRRAHLSVAKANGGAKAVTYLQQGGETASSVVMGLRDRTLCVVMPFRFKDKRPYTGWVQPERRELAQAA